MFLPPDNRVVHPCCRKSLLCLRLEFDLRSQITLCHYYSLSDMGKKFLHYTYACPIEILQLVCNCNIGISLALPHKRIFLKANYLNAFFNTSISGWSTITSNPSIFKSTIKWKISVTLLRVKAPPLLITIYSHPWLINIDTCPLMWCQGGISDELNLHLLFCPPQQRGGKSKPSNQN